MSAKSTNAKTRNSVKKKLDSIKYKKVPETPPYKITNN